MFSHCLISTQEGEAGNEQSGGHKESLGRLDLSQHYLLIFTQVTNGLPFVRIDTSKANWEGEPPHPTRNPLEDINVRPPLRLPTPHFRSLFQRRASWFGAHQPDVHFLTSHGPTAFCSY